MEIPALIVSFAVGGAALAAWLFARFPGLVPASFSRAAVHVCAAVLLGQLGMVAGGVLAHDSAGLFLFLFGLALPALVYSFLSCLWMFRVCQNMLGNAIR